MMECLLLEIGTEEIPAGYIQPALTALEETMSQRLVDMRISHGTTAVFGTPRRLAIRIDQVAAAQPPRSLEVLGPPVRIGYDSDGKPTIAAQKFAEKIGVTVDRLETRETDKGQYLCAVQEEKGRQTKDLLAEIFPDVILSLPFPKTMRWAALDVSFARPIQWILALYGKKIISCQLGNVKSGRTTRGHRFLFPKKINIEHPDAYVEKLRDAHVLADIGERKALLERLVTSAAREAGGTLLNDPDLTDIVCHLLEEPSVSCGSFDLDFLELPDEVLITAMREHQKYFSITDTRGALMPHFIAVNNTRCRDMQLVTSGHERVLRARLNDARFFFQSDLRVTLEARLEKLKGVLFQKELGNMYEKVKRVEKIVQYLSESLGLPSETRRQTARAARFSKSDLVSHLVVEFPKLQGVMGRIYAEKAGESPLMSTAIEEHYRPTHAGGVLPETISGAVLGIADKIDSICGCFTAGLIPTGASDPYALRRQAIGLVHIALDQQFAFPLEELVSRSLKQFGPKGAHEVEQCARQVMAFLQSRMIHMLTEEGYARDVAQAVTAVSIDPIPAVWKKVAALQTLQQQPDFEPLAVAFKRVVNIIRKSGDGINTALLPPVDSKLFAHPCEGALYDAYRHAAKTVDTEMANNRFAEALLAIAALKAPVDDFFDGVMVMAEDESLQNNRLALLGEISRLFETFADFSKIST